MKLLGWMHRKFRQGSTEPLKDFSLGNPSSLDDIHRYPKANYFAKSSSKSHHQRDNLVFRKSFAADSRADEDLYFEEDSSAQDALSDLFHGFLAIGTLGGSAGDPLGANADPASTPTFSISVENLAEKETEVTENDLRLINDELEKVLGAEALRSDHEISSGRSSHVSNARSSYCSTITLSGKQLESFDNNGGTNICPLQGYLFGSAIGLPETAAKKEPRPSLGELFQKTKMADNDQSLSGSKFDRGEKRMEKEHDKPSAAVHLLKKILKKGTASSKASTADPIGDTKVNKVLQMFHRKVHPENTEVAEKHEKPSKNDNMIVYDNLGGGEDVALMPKRRMSKEGLRRLKSQSGIRRHFGINDPNENKECWIKSDADYLVLEL